MEAISDLLSFWFPSIFKTGNDFQISSDIENWHDLSKNVFLARYKLSLAKNQLQIYMAHSATNLCQLFYMVLYSAQNTIRLSM